MRWIGLLAQSHYLHEIGQFDTFPLTLNKDMYWIRYFRPQWPCAWSVERLTRVASVLVNVSQTHRPDVISCITINRSVVVPGVTVYFRITLSSNVTGHIEVTSGVKHSS